MPRPCFSCPVCFQPPCAHRGARGWLQDLLRDRCCLVVLDDVRDERQVAPFKQLCPPTGSTLSLLITTRLRELGSSFGKLQALPPLGTDDSMRILASYSGREAQQLRDEGNVAFNKGRKHDNYRKGEEVLLDMLLLSRCDWLLHAASGERPTPP